MRKVSLFDRAGNFAAYVEVQGTPRVVVLAATDAGPTRYFVAFDVVAPRGSYREVEAEVVGA